MAKSIKQLDSEILDCGNKMQAILDVATESTGGKLSAEQKTAYDELDKQYDALIDEKQELAAAIERQEKLAAKDARSKQLSGVIGSTPGRITTPDPIVLSNQREAFLSDPKRGFKDHR